MAPDYNSSSSNTDSHARDNTNYDVSDLLKQLLEEAGELLGSNSSSGRILYAFVRRNLSVFHLNDDFSEAAILNEALIRAVSAALRGTVIRDLSAWLRTTAYNIIREKARDRRKFVSLETQSEQVEQIQCQPEDIEEDLSFIQAAFGLLDPRDQRLLSLKIVQGLSWQEIHDIFNAEGYGHCSIATLRKQKERALVRLRKKFHALKPEL